MDNSCPVDNTQGVRGGGKYYYEVEVAEDSGLARVGWAQEGALFDLGTDNLGYGYGADRDGFGITGQQGKKLHADAIENYGEVILTQPSLSYRIHSLH